MKSKILVLLERIQKNIYIYMKKEKKREREKVQI